MFPTCIRERYGIKPKTLSSQMTTKITTTLFKMDLIVPCMGIRLTSHRRTPTTIKVSRFESEAFRTSLVFFLSEIDAGFAPDGRFGLSASGRQATLFCRISRSMRTASSLRAFWRLRSLEGLSLLAEWLI